MNKESHNFEHSHEHSVTEFSSITFTLFLNLFFAILELIAYFLTNSVSMFSSSIHDFGDAVILFFSALLEKISGKRRTNRYTYGYRRFTLVAASINAVILFMGSIFIIKKAIERILNPEVVDAKIVLIMAGIGIVVNIVGVMKLAKSDSLLNRSLVLNLKADIYNFLFILIGSVFILLWDLYIVDSLFSIFIAVKMIIEVTKELALVFMMMMQATPKDIDYEKIIKHLNSYEQVVDVHDVHIWNLDGHDYIMSLHIVVDFKKITTEEIMSLKNTIKLDLEKYKINHTTIEVDSIEYAIEIGEIYH